MSTNTTNYGLVKPGVNDPVDQDLWGGELNSDMDDLDGLLKTAINWTPSAQTANFSITAPTTGSTTTGSARVFYLCDATSGNITAALPAATTCSGMVVAFKKTDASANTIIIDGNASETIDGATTYVIDARYNSVTIESNGTAWHVLSSNLVQVTPPAQNIVIRSQKFTSTGTYTPDASLIYCIIECWGGGGGGGGAAANLMGHGGGSGSYSSKIASASDIGMSKAVTIGAAGAAGTTGANAGGVGGDTSVGSLCIGKAGGGGGTGLGSAPGAGGIAGTGDNTSVGAFGFGGGGGPGGSSVPLFGGSGGCTSRGGNGRGGAITATASTNDGVSATSNSGSGGGGGAAFNGGSTAAGGNGGSGYVFITEYCSA